MWLGVAYSVRAFIEVFLAHKVIDRIQAFNEVIIWLDPNLEYSADEWLAWLRVGRRTYEEKLRQAAQSREAQAAADARNAAMKGGKGMKGTGKGRSAPSHPYQRYW